MHERIQNILDDVEKSGEKVRNINVFLNDPGTTVIINYSKGEGRQTEPIDLVKRDHLDQTLNTLAARDRVEGSGVRYHEQTDSGHVSPNLHNPCPLQTSDEHPGNDEEECDSDDDDDDDYDESGDEEEDEDCDSAASASVSDNDDDDDDDDNIEEVEDAIQQRTIAATHNSYVSRLRNDEHCDNGEEEETMVEGEYDDDDDDDDDDIDDDGDENIVKDTDGFVDNEEVKNIVIDEDDGEDKEDTMVKDKDDDCDTDDDEENVVEDEDDDCRNDDDEENVVEDEDDDDGEEENALLQGDDDCDDDYEEEHVVLDEDYCDNDDDEEYMGEDEGDDDTDVNDTDDSSRQGAEQRDTRKVDPAKEMNINTLMSLCNEYTDRICKKMDSICQKPTFKSVTDKNARCLDSEPSASEKDCVSDSNASTSDECKDNGIETGDDQEHNVIESSVNEESHSYKSENANEGNTVIAKGDLGVHSTKLTLRSLIYLTPSSIKTTLCEENSGNKSESSEKAKESGPEERVKNYKEYFEDELYGIKTECTREEFAHKIRDPTRNKKVNRVVQSKFPYLSYLVRDLYFNCVYDDIIVVLSYKSESDDFYGDRYCKLYDSWLQYANTTSACIIDSTHPLYPRIIATAMGCVDADLRSCLRYHPLPSPSPSDDEDGKADAANGEDGDKDHGADHLDNDEDDDAGDEEEVDDDDDDDGGSAFAGQ